MKVIITGATGFIGQALVAALRLRGDGVVALTRSESHARAALPGDVEVREWNPPELGRWADLFSEVDAVVNLAGAPVADKPWTEARKRLIRDSRVDSTRAVVDAIRQSESKPSVLVNQSAIGFYGSRGDEILTEESASGDDFLAGVVKDWGAEARKVETLGVRLVTFAPRSFSVRMAAPFPDLLCLSSSLAAGPWDVETSGSRGSILTTKSGSLSSPSRNRGCTASSMPPHLIR